MSSYKKTRTYRPSTSHDVCISIEYFIESDGVMDKIKDPDITLIEGDKKPINFMKIIDFLIEKNIHIREDKFNKNRLAIAVPRDGRLFNVDKAPSILDLEFFKNLEKYKAGVKKITKTYFEQQLEAWLITISLGLKAI